MHESPPKVSVLSPCYNVAPYIARFLDSLLAQTYKNLEIILVNDGSTDNTASIIASYIPRLEKQGYSVIYLTQENGGQSSAVNNGLKYVTGKYLTWPDSDDWFTPDSIEIKTRFMEAHPEAGLIRGNLLPIVEETGEKQPLFSEPSTRPKLREDFFDHLIFDQAWLAPVGYMARTACLDATIPGREIYVSKRAGQNWQIMLPIARQFPCWELPDLVGYYCMRSNSHSHSQNAHAKQIAFKDMCEDILRNTLNRLPGGNELLPRVEEKMNRDRLLIASANCHYPDMWKYGIRLLHRAKGPREALLTLLRMCIPARVYNFCRRLRHRLLP